tara:strand:- start:17662 stop:19377 length:1716 start_codon:yes stop_codon:yes gene_type:complete
VYFSYCYYSNAQLLDEGSTTTTEIEQQGDVEEITETTVTIEHKDTGDVLDGDTGVVQSRYEGDADIDWGGAGSVYSHTSCTDALSGFPATGTDGRTSACGHARTNSLTTWRQYVDLNSFGIEEGGEVNYEFLFAFPNSMYQNSGQTAYVQTKGYNDNVLQWETGLVTIDKTTFTQNPYNYNNNTNWVNTVTGSHDFANELDKVYIEIGGYGEYFWDEFQYNVVYNHITTTVETWMQIAQQEQDTTTTLDIMNTYNPIDTLEDTSTPVEEVQDLVEVIEMPDLPDMTMNLGEPMVEIVPIEETMPIETTFEDTTVSFEPVITMEAVTEEIAEVMNLPEISEPIEPMATETNNDPIEMPEIAQQEPEPIEVESQPEPEIVANTPEEPVNEDIETPSEAPTEPVEEVEDSNPTTETASNDEPVEETKEEPKEVVEEQPEPEPQEKEVAENEPKEEPEEIKEEVKEEPKQEEEVKEAKAEDKPTKKQEAKQEKAKEIMQSFDSQYDAVAQLTTLALVNALGADITTYQQVPTQVQPTWYESKEIYANTILQDQLGAYYGVRDSLVFEQMIGAQYE